MIALIPGAPAIVNFILFAVLVGLAIGGATIYSVQSAARARLNRRIAAVAGILPGAKGAAGGAKAGGQRRKLVQAKLKEIEDKAKAKKKSGSVRELLTMANLDWTPTRFYVVSAIVGLVAGLLYLARGFAPIGFPLVVLAMGLGFPRWVLKKRIARRQKAFTLKFADAVDVIVRGIKSGLPVGECITMIGRESPEPVGLEFRLITEGQKLGMTMDEVLARALLRMPTQELRFFAIVLSIQQQTGGNLADTLAKLSDVLRQRKKLKDKIKALSSEAKASASIIGSLPFLMTGILALVSPNYIGTLFSDPIGHILIACGFAWMGTGIFIMTKMVNFDF